MIIHKPKL